MKLEDLSDEELNEVRRRLLFTEGVDQRKQFNLLIKLANELGRRDRIKRDLQPLTEEELDRYLEQNS